MLVSSFASGRMRLTKKYRRASMQWSGPSLAGRLRSPDYAVWSDLYVARLEREALYRQMLSQREA